MQLDVYDIIAKTFVNICDTLKANPVFLIFLIAAVVIAILKAVKTPISSKEKGAYGEMLIENELNRLTPYGQGEKILRNIYIPKDDGSTSEIDVLYISRKGIFVFESNVNHMATLYQKCVIRLSLWREYYCVIFSDTLSSSGYKSLIWFGLLTTCCQN